MNLDKNVKGDWKKTKKSVTQWIKLLRRIDDHKLQKICGTDIALYVIWLRYAAVFFGVISVINILIIAVYLSGTPKAEDDFRQGIGYDSSVLQMLTILNISNTQYKVILTYFNCTVTITGLTLFFVFKYMTKYQMYEQIDKQVNLNSEVSDMQPASASSVEVPDQISNDPSDYGMKRYTDLEIADHAIMIENLPKTIPR